MARSNAELVVASRRLNPKPAVQYSGAGRRFQGLGRMAPGRALISCGRWRRAMVIKYVKTTTENNAPPISKPGWRDLGRNLSTAIATRSSTANSIRAGHQANGAHWIR